jgi:hypothetical protein
MIGAIFIPDAEAHTMIKQLNKIYHDSKSEAVSSAFSINDNSAHTSKQTTVKHPNLNYQFLFTHLFCFGL